MATIADLVVSLSADIASFRAGMSEANQSLATLQQQSSESGEAVKELSSILESVISVEGIRRIAEFGVSLIESAAQAEHMAQALGTTVEAFQSQQYAASQAGVSSDTFSRSMETLSRNIDLIASGSGGRAAKVFADLGLSVTNADGTMRSAGDVLEDLAHNKIFAAQDATQKLGEVMLIMGGRTGDAALMVNALGKNFDAATAAGQRFALDNGTAKAAEEIATGFENAWRATKNFLTTMTVEALTQPASPFSFIGGLMGVKPPELNSPAQPAQAKPPGPPVVDPTQAKELQNFQEAYTKLLQTEQEDADYQAKLRVAYQEGAAEVAKLAAAHAADRAQLELLEAAQRDHVTATQAEINAVREAAAANAMNTKLAAEQKQLTDALAESQKKYSDQVTTVMNETDGLTEKQNKLADTLGILEQQYVSGAISLQDYAQRAAAAKQLIEGLGADKGEKELTSGLSSDLSGLIGKLTDVQTLMANKQKGESIFAQLTQDTNEFVKSLGDLLLKLLIINPLLNSLGLGDQGNGKQLPTLFDNGGLGGSAGTASPFSAIGSSIEGGGKSVLSFLSGLFGGTTGPGAAVDADSATGASLNSDIVDALTGSGLGGGFGDPFDEMPAFAHGGDFTVDGSGGTDSKRVSFLASPGERVSVTPQIGSSSAANDSRRGRGDITINMPISGVHSDSFRATQHQITGDMLRGISAARRYAQ
jgi:hypothetical protein